MPKKLSFGNEHRRFIGKEYEIRDNCLNFVLSLSVFVNIANPDAGDRIGIAWARPAELSYF